ncbi:MAG TPA: hypothetical protein VGJ05_02795 [Fimbriiglobus sp.]|jgi:protein-S-isoprenylcysteine O-methyltransferase Ste14
MVRRSLILAYGLAAYALFFASFLYACGFIGDLGTPTSLGQTSDTGVGVAIAVDFALLGLFAVQHSAMARPVFKRWLTRHIPKSIERSTYVLMSSLALFVLFAFWQPLPGVVWHVENPLARGLLYAVFAFGMLTVFGTSWLINHFDLFGLRQVWLAFRDRPYTPLPFGTPGLYKHVRHPLYVGWLLAFWAIPTMTIAHLFFAVGTTAYILIAIGWEERDLVDYHPEYAAYRKRVPALFPRLGAKPRGGAGA